MRARTNIDSFTKKSLVLPSNPKITDIKIGDSELTVYWQPQYTEVEVDHFNIYFATDKPASLKYMTRVDSVPASEREHTIKGLINNKTYYIAVESVDVKGYENASLLEVKNGVPSSVFLVATVGNDSYLSRDGMNWVYMDGLPVGDNKIYHFLVNKDDIFITNRNNTLYYSVNGGKWIAGAATRCKYFAYGKGYFVGMYCEYSSNSSGDANGRIYAQYSIDLVTWYEIESSIFKDSYINKVSDLCYVNGLFIAVGKYTYYSSDVKTWKRMISPDFDGNQGANHMMYGNDIYVLLSEYSYVNAQLSSKVCYSLDGKNWIYIGSSYFISGDSYYYKYKGLAYGKDKFVIVGNNGLSRYSQDGKSWSYMSGLPSGTTQAVTYADDRFMAIVSGNEATKIAYSLDGKSWINNGTINSVASGYTVRLVSNRQEGGN